MGFETGIVAGDDGVEIAFNVKGDGPAVLMIHGFPVETRIWRADRHAGADVGWLVGVAAVAGLS